MKQSQLIKVIDLLSFVALVAMLATGFLIEYSLPERSGASAVWGLTRHEWGDLHFYCSVMFLVLMSAHLLTHLKYIKSAVLGKATREQLYRLAVGLVGLSALILFIFILITAPVDLDERPKGWQQKTHE